MSHQEPLHEPHKIKTVRLLAFPSMEERKRNLVAAGFNVWHLTPAQVAFDMCSVGTSASSQEQHLHSRMLIDRKLSGWRRGVNIESHPG